MNALAHSALADHGPATSPRVRGLPGQRETADRLVAALRGEEFVLYAQPILPIGEGLGVKPCQEILVRFLEEEQKLLPPGSFIPILEAYGLMTYLDRWVVNRTIRWLRRQIAPEAATCSAVNVSVESLLDASFPAFVEKQVASSGIPGAQLVFEVTWPDAVLLRPRVATLAATLRELGCGLSLASFEGETGSLAQLEALAPAFVKVSGDLVARMARDPMEAATVEGIAQHCRELGIRTVAEFVEDEQTLSFAQAAGIDYVQGFLVAVPGPLA